MQGCQWWEVNRITLCIREEGELRKKVWGTSLLPQVVLASSLKSISSSIPLRQWFSTCGPQKYFAVGHRAFWFEKVVCTMSCLFPDIVRKLAESCGEWRVELFFFLFFFGDHLLAI